ncbi:MAG: glycosyltransferase family 4 protein [Solirubrobacteraceae bacterium]
MTATVGVMFPGDPTARGRWSGTSSGVVSGLEELGIEVLPINVDSSPQISRWLSLAAGGLMVASIARAGLPVSPRELRRVGVITPAVAAARSALANRRLREAQPLDGLIQIGTGYLVRTGVPLVTFEDMTAVQARNEDYQEWRAMPAWAVAARVNRQRNAYRRARGCCVSTHWAAASVVSDYGIPVEKVHVVGVGRNFEPPGAFTRAWSTPRFLFVGRDWARKNGERLLAAFSRLRAEVPEARLDVVGAHPPLHADGLVGHGVLQLTDGAHRARLASLFAEATCFVMPSLHEPAGLAYVEAGAWGIPSIATCAGGAAEFVGDGGLVVDPRDEDQLLGAMRDLCDPATAERLGRIAKEHSRQFTSRTMAGRLLRALALPSVADEPLPAFL